MIEDEVTESNTAAAIGAVVVVVAGVWYVRKSLKLRRSTRVNDRKIKNFDYALSAFQRCDRIANSPAHDLNDLKQALKDERDFLEFISTAEVK